MKKCPASWDLSDKLVTLMKCPASWNLGWQVGYLDEEVPRIMKCEATSWYLDEVPSIMKIWSDKLITLMKKCPASWNVKWEVDYLDEKVPSIMKCEVRSWSPWWSAQHHEMWNEKLVTLMKKSSSSCLTCPWSCSSLIVIWNENSSLCSSKIPNEHNDICINTSCLLSENAGFISPNTSKPFCNNLSPWSYLWFLLTDSQLFNPSIQRWLTNVCNSTNLSQVIKE